MVKHTPGPWRIIREDKDTTRDNIPRGSKRSWWAVLDPNNYLAKLPLSREADARLIAAAPDLLEALEDAAKTIEEMGCTCAGGMEDGHDADCVGVMHADRARAAIAKARGES